MADATTTDVFYVPVTKAAEMFGVDKSTIYDLASSGRILRRYIGSRRYVIDVESLRQYFKSLPTEPPI
jgi:hypothetical protein